MLCKGRLPATVPDARPLPTSLPRPAGQRSGVDIYHQELSTPDFISIKNLWASKRGSGAAGGAAPVLNLSYLIDHVMEAVHPLVRPRVLHCM